MARTRQMAVAAVLAVGVLVLAGCGSSATTSSNVTDASQVEPGTSVPTTEAAPIATAEPTADTSSIDTLADADTTLAEPSDSVPATEPGSSTPDSTADAAVLGTPLADWIDEQEAAGRSQGYTISGDGTDARVIVAISPTDFTDVAGGLLLATGNVVGLPDGISTTRAPDIAGLGGAPVLISALDDHHAMWQFDPETGSWVEGPELGVFADPQSLAFVAVLDDRLVVANQTVSDDGTGRYLPDRFEGVIVDADLSTTPMSPPPDRQFFWITSKVGSHALMLGLDSAADVNDPLTQPWDFDATTNTWSAIPQPDWLGCVPTCNWMEPHEGPDPHLEVVVGGRVVMRLPDGSIAAYAPATQTWTRLDDAPFELTGPAVAVLGDQIAMAPLISGFGTNEPGVVGVLDLTTGAWTTDRIDVGDVSDAGYVPIESRTDGSVGLFDVIHTGAAEPEPSAPDAAYDPTTRTWRAPTPDEVELWNRLEGFGGSGLLRDVLI